MKISEKGETMSELRQKVWRKIWATNRRITWHNEIPSLDIGDECEMFWAVESEDLATLKQREQAIGAVAVKQIMHNGSPYSFQCCEDTVQHLAGLIVSNDLQPHIDAYNEDIEAKVLDRVKALINETTIWGTLEEANAQEKLLDRLVKAIEAIKTSD